MHSLLPPGGKALAWMLASLHRLRSRATTITRRRLHSSSSAAAASSWLSAPGNPLMRWPPPPPASRNPPNQAHHPTILSSSHDPPPPPCTDEEATHVAAISQLLAATTTDDDPSALHSALVTFAVPPSSTLLDSVLRSSPGLAPAQAIALSRWAGAELPTLVDLLARARAFDLVWSILLDSSGPHPITIFSALFRRYSRAAMPHAAARTYFFLRSNSHLVSSDNDRPDPFELLLDALCKEGHARVAAECVARRRAAEPPGWAPSVLCYNILLHGWFRVRRPRKAEKLWAEMRSDSPEPPTAVTYGTLIEGLCRHGRLDDAFALLDEMRKSGLAPNHFTCNPLIDALAESARFKEAMGLLEKFPLFGVSPNISTYNSLVKGFCKNKDLVGASKILKMMIGRGVLPTARTYNYFFLFFARFGKIEEGMNLYTKMVECGNSPDRVTYQLLIKMLCEKDKLDLAVQVINEMNRNGFESDLATSTMLVHLLCRLRKFEEACVEFENMIKRGFVPQFITFYKLVKELRRLGLHDMAKKISDLMDSVPHSTKLPGTYREREGDEVVKLRKSIMKKAQVMSEALKVCKDPEERSKLKSSTDCAIESANRLIADIRQRVYTVHSA